MKMINNKLLVAAVISLITTAAIANPGANRRITILNETNTTFTSLGCLGNEKTIAPGKSHHDGASRNYCTFWLQNHMSVDITKQSNLKRYQETCGKNNSFRRYTPKFYSNNFAITVSECLTPALGNRSTVTVTVKNK